MRLTELDPKFLKVIDEHTFNTQATIHDDGISFLCPKCFQENGGPVGTHSCICWTPKVPQTIQPTPGRWEMHGTGFEDLTLVAGSSSVQLLGGCNAHFLHQEWRHRVLLMAKVHKIDNCWVFECPGCGYDHMYDPRWTFNGDVDKPTFTPSLLCNEHHPASRCHLNMTDGQIKFHDDCHHALKGQTVEMKEYEV